MWDCNWFDVSTTDHLPIYNDTDRTWRCVFDDDSVQKDVPVMTATELARKLKVARFAHVPVDCLEIETETKEA